MVDTHDKPKVTLDDIDEGVRGFRTEVEELKETIAKDVIQRIDAMEEHVREKFTEERVQELIDAHIQEVLDNPDSEFARKMRFPTETEEPIVGTKFARWNLGVADIEFAYDLLQAAKRANLSSGPSEDLENTFREISDAYYITEEQAKELDRKAIDNAFPRIKRSMLGRAWSRFNNADEYRRWESMHRAMDSAETGFGLELMANQYVEDLWEGARQESLLFPLFQSFEMTDATTFLPVPADIPELWHVGENTTADADQYTQSKSGSNRVQVDAKKFIISQMWSDELEEDSIIPFVPFIRAQAQTGLAHYSDSAVMNGDATNSATGNINLDDADPNDEKHYLAFDGVRHVGLVDNTNNEINVASTIALTHFRSLRKLMDDSTYLNHWGMPVSREDLIYTMDPDTYFNILDNVDEIQTPDKYGANAVILRGEIGRIDGFPIVPSQALSLTEADGKVSATSSNNTLGQMVAFNRRGYVVGWRRRVMVETERLPRRGQTALIFSLRMGFGRFTPTGNASGIESAAVARNITVS